MYNNETLSTTCPHYNYPAVLNILRQLRMTNASNNFFVLFGSIRGCGGAAVPTSVLKFIIIYSSFIQYWVIQIHDGFFVS